MANNTSEITNFFGVDNKHAPESLVDRSKKSAYLTEGKNIDISSKYSISRRCGYEKVIDGNFHSLWGNKDYTFVMSDGTFTKINNDLSLTGMGANVFGSLPLSYADTGSFIYISDGIDIIKTDGTNSFVIQNGATYENPSHQFYKENAPVDTDIYDAPQAGNPIAWMFGRLWCATKDAIFYSKGYEPDLFNLETDYIDIKNVSMLGAVDDGYYIGTDAEVYFISGGDPNTPTRLDVVSKYGAVKGTCISIDAQQLGLESGEGKALVFESKRGKIVALNGGKIVEATEDKIAYSVGNAGAMFMREQNGESHLISSLRNLGDTDGANMRATDYAEAEIIRQ